MHFSSESKTVDNESVEQPGNSDKTEARTSTETPSTETSLAPGNNAEQTNKVGGTTTKATKPPEVTISAADLQLSMARPPGSAQPAVKTS